MDLSKLITVDDVSKYLVENGIPQDFTVVLKDNYIDGLEFRELEYQDLLLMLPGKLGIVKKIWRLIRHYFDQFGNSLINKENLVDDGMQVNTVCPDISDSQSPGRDIVSTSKVNITSPSRNECTAKEVSRELSPVSSENIPKTPGSDSSSLDVAETIQHASQLMELDYISKREASVPSLPIFSSRIRAALKAENLDQLYDKFVAEVAYDLIGKGDVVNDRTLYEKYCMKMFKKYPCIELPGGRKEWSIFSKKLSGRLRYLRWRQQKDERDMPFLKRRKSLLNLAPRRKKLKHNGYLENELDESCYEEDPTSWLEDVVYVPIKQEIPDREEYSFGKEELDITTLQELDDGPEDANNDLQRAELGEFMNKVKSSPIEDNSSSDLQNPDEPRALENLNLSQESNKISVTYGDVTKRALINRDCIKSTIEIIKKKFQFHPMDKIRIEGKIDEVDDYIALNPEDDEDIQELKRCIKLRIKKIQEVNNLLPHFNAPLRNEACISQVIDTASTSNINQQSIDSCSAGTTREGHSFAKGEKCYTQDQLRIIDQY